MSNDAEGSLPARGPAHQLDHHDALVRFGGGVELADGVRGRLHGRRKAEGELRGGEVVVDGLRHADDLEPLLRQRMRDTEGPIAADGDDGVHAEVCERVDDSLRAVLVRDGPVRGLHGPAHRVAPVGRSKDGPAQVRDPANRVPIQALNAALLEESVVAVPDPVDLPAQPLGREHDGTDDCVETRGVTAPCVDRDSSNGTHRLRLPRWM